MAECAGLVVGQDVLIVEIKTTMYFVYILKCKDNSLYTGITTDVERRFLEHRNGKGGHYTSSKGVTKIVYKEKHLDRSSASKREAEIKGFTRQKKLSLVQSVRL